jgi:phosphoribosylglycinamide formyltransferase-1
MTERGRVGILISGRGSNMVALVEAMQAGKIQADPAVVVSNVPDAPGLTRAREWGIPTAVIEHKKIRSRTAHELKVIEVLREQRVDLVCLAGYMRLLSPAMVGEFRNRIVNIHPALLPAFPGLHGQRQALEHGVKVTGCTVHFVDEECDHGPIILQVSVPVHEDDTENSLSARILEAEHRTYVEAVALFFEGRLTIEDRRVHIAAPAAH